MLVQDDIIVNDELIEYAERIILPGGMSFDQERRKYLSDFTTLDLKAVPGSGKTTLLLAKLLILEKNLPLKSGRSILVLSHTNTAVDEIEVRLRKYCPKLFSYPNFVGTIQSFVNKFLAIPYFESISRKNVVSIDEEFNYKFIEMKYESIQKKAVKVWLEKRHDPITLLRSLRFSTENDLVQYINGTSDSFPLTDKKCKTYEGLVEFKKSIIMKGILHYDDAYYLANRYMITNPTIMSILRQRFGFVFVDEMQDMDIHQYKILEVFNHKDVCFQRLGDNNQAIYNGIVYGDNLWSIRMNTRMIKGSYRLTKINAALISRIGVDGVEINGLNTNDKEFKPVLVVFKDDEHKCKVIQSFSEYLNSIFQSEENFKFKNGYKVIAWRKEHENHHLTLKEYCPEYLKMKKKSKLTNDTASNYDIVKSIYDAIGEVCFCEQIVFFQELVTKENIRKLINKNIDQQKNIELDIYNLVTYNLTNDAANYENTFINVLKYVLGLFKVGEERIKQIIAKKEAHFRLIEESSEYIGKECYKCSVCGEMPIVGTVHSVKGETHDVTLFLESFFYGKFESDILYQAILGEKSVKELIDIEKKSVESLTEEIQRIEIQGKTYGIKSRIALIKKHQSQIEKLQQYSKLVYVALSRATGIVGYAICESRYKKYLDGKLDEEEWHVLRC